MEQTKQNIINAEPEIIVIPEEFYGGVKKAVTPSVAAPAIPAAPTTIPRSAPPPPAGGAAGGAAKAPSGAKVSLAVKLQQPPFLLRAIAGFLVAAIGLATIYYLNQGRQARQNFVRQLAGQNLGGQAKPPEPVTPPPPPAPEPTAPPAPEPPPPTPPPVYPPKNYVMATDSDGDGLTDTEEVIYNTDSHKPDTDGDGYVDGLEVENLYNPTGFKPERLLPTGLVKLYHSSVFNYSIFYPHTFAMQTLDFTGREAIFTSETGEFIEVIVVDNPERLPVADWYLKAAPGTTSADLKTVTTKQKVAGIFSPDGLTAYFALDDKIYTVAYNIGLRSDANFLTTFKMMINSLRLNELPLAPAPRPTEPLAPSSAGLAPTTTPEVSPPAEATTTP